MDQCRFPRILFLTIGMGKIHGNCKEMAWEANPWRKLEAEGNCPEQLPLFWASCVAREAVAGQQWQDHLLQENSLIAEPEGLAPGWRHNQGCKQEPGCCIPGLGSICSLDAPRKRFWVWETFPSPAVLPGAVQPCCACFRGVSASS